MCAGLQIENQYGRQIDNLKQDGWRGVRKDFAIVPVSQTPASEQTQRSEKVKW